MEGRRALHKHCLSLMVFTAVAVAWALFLFDRGGGLPSFSDTYEVSAVIPTGAALAPGSRVTVAGAQVGKVKSVKRLGRGARLLLEIEDDEVLPLPRDSRVHIRQHTPVGENYVSIEVGRSTQTIASGGGLPVEQADEFVDVDRLLSVLKGGTRERARQTVKSLGMGLDGRGEQLNVTLREAGDFLRHAQDFVDVLYAERKSTARLVDQLGNVAAAIGQRDQAIRDIGDRGLVALDALRRQDEALGETIDALPATLRSVKKTSGVLRSTSGTATPVVDELTGALKALQPVVKRLPAASSDGRAVLRELSAAAPILEDTLERVTKLSDPLAAALPKLHRVVCEVAPVARYAKPYFPEVLHIVIGLGSSSNSYDATGHLIRLAPIVGENSVVALPAEISAGVSDLLYKSPLTSLNFDPYPKPGSLGKTVAKGNQPLGPSKIPETGYVYPRVHADC
ncbi:MAG: MlaD family protein [Solirubrobacteraceae bacterium]|nr:MlaD family protein [Solirubrobacteraceae bacterium]